MLDAHRVLAYSLVAVCGAAGIAGVVAYAATLFAMGWRLRELRGH